MWIAHNCWISFCHFLDIRSPRNSGFKAKFSVLMDIFETGEFILGQIAYTFKYSGCDAAIQPPVSLIFIHGPVILPYISNTV